MVAFSADVGSDNTRRRSFCQTADSGGLGPALRWALSDNADVLDLIAEAPVAGAIARRAELMTPAQLGLELHVWSADGAELEPAKPAPLPAAPELGSGYERFAELIERAGARPVDDFGMLVAEIDGLEVARVVTRDVFDPPPGGEVGSGDELMLSVGVGQADRELQSYVHGHLDDETNLRRAIEAVRQHRSPAAISHPLSRLARQRWLRSVVVDDPGSVGLVELVAAPPLGPRETLLGTEPCAAVGRGVNGPAVVVFSVGVDLDLLPEAVDYRARHARAISQDHDTIDLVVVVPERDRRLAIGALAKAVPKLRLAEVGLPWEFR